MLSNPNSQSISVHYRCNFCWEATAVNSCFHFSPFPLALYRADGLNSPCPLSSGQKWSSQLPCFWSFDVPKLWPSCATISAAIENFSVEWWYFPFQFSCSLPFVCQKARRKTRMNKLYYIVILHLQKWNKVQLMMVFIHWASLGNRYLRLIPHFLHLKTTFKTHTHTHTQWHDYKAAIKVISFFPLAMKSDQGLCKSTPMDGVKHGCAVNGYSGEAGIVSPRHISLRCCKDNFDILM